MVVTISENFQKFNRVWHTFQPSRYRRESPDMRHHLPIILANLPVKLPFSVPKHAFSEQNLVIIFNSPGIVLLLPVKISEISEISRFQLLRGLECLVWCHRDLWHKFVQNVSNINNSSRNRNWNLTFSLSLEWGIR